MRQIHNTKQKKNPEHPYPWSDGANSTLLARFTLKIKIIFLVQRHQGKYGIFILKLL